MGSGWTAATLQIYKCNRKVIEMKKIKEILHERGVVVDKMKAMLDKAESENRDLADDAAPLVLGTFDSRSVAIAYANSETFRSHLADLHDQLADARAEGDTQRVAELEAYGPALQARLHAQGFSTASVADTRKFIS